MTSGGYSSWHSVLQAVKSRAKSTRVKNIQVAVQQVYFDRFLCRVFADSSNSDWLLKGGMGLLARVPNARTTKDLDLSANSIDLDEAIAALARRARVDLDDNLRFEVVRVRETGKGANQPDARTRNVIFSCQDDRGRHMTDIPVDVVVEHAPVGTVEVVDPANRLALPRPLPTFPYRLWPTVDQVADKACATMATYGGHPSSRIKDLVDLSLIANTQDLSLIELRQALELKQTLSRIPPFSEFTPPAPWKHGYAKLAGTTPAAAVDFDTATQLVAGLLEPALSPHFASDQWWTPGRGWGPQPDDQPNQQQPIDGVWVRSHSRADVPVRGHWRSPRNP